MTILSAAAREELARSIGSETVPTEEQAKIIQFDRDQPALVVAGAGSGKTLTMAQRVVWLVANGKARPSEILGLTFTRKATAELATRIGKSLAKRPEPSRRDGEAQSVSRDDAASLFDTPTISTYNAFANRLFQENALRVGYEPESTLLTDAGAWQLAYDLVVASTDDRLQALDKTPASITALVLDLAHGVTDNLVDSEALAAFPDAFLAMKDLPGKEHTKSIRTAIDSVTALPVLLSLATRFAEAKRQRGLIEYADQVKLALQALRAAPGVVAEYRRRYRYILLDEYQDTSVSQTRLLAHLFHDMPVMAVGDPNQSIYGWRGAAAGNLARFVADFTTEPHRSHPVAPFTLSTSWRNDTSILRVANAVVGLGDTAGGGAREGERGVDAPVVTLAARPGAGAGSVEYAEMVTLDDEAEQVAEIIAGDIAAHDSAQQIAILFRTRKHMSVFAEALRERGIPHEVVGIGGVLESPEVVDLRCALAVVANANSGNELIRLLTGPRWRLGVRDIAVLNRYARYLSRRRLDGASVDDLPIGSVSMDDEVTIVDALDTITALPGNSPHLDRFSDLGKSRIRDAAQTFARLRRNTGRPLRDVVRIIERELSIDIEVIANERNEIPRRNLDVFAEKVAEYEASVTNATLSGLVSWLGRLASEERLMPEQVQPEPGTVQLLTIHAAKGLEWDLVVLPRFVKDEYPARSQGGIGWLHVGKLPNEFRGDGRDIPQLAWRSARDTADFKSIHTAYEAAEREHRLAEESRILYVAVTRPRRRLVLTASFLSGTRASRYARSPRLADIDGLFTEFGPRLRDDEIDAVEEGRAAAVEAWPRDPLGQRRPAVEKAAALVRDACEDPQAKARTGRYADDIELLLAERCAEARVGAGATPKTIAASHLASFVTDPAEMLRSALRPIPAQPSAVANLGTVFHAWVATRFAAVPGYQDPIDVGPIAREDDLFVPSAIDEAAFLALRETFLASQWAGLSPVDVEVAVSVVLGGKHIACKIDAVFPRDDGGYEIVDWKTGALPQGEDDQAAKAIQLALYRYAYANWKHVNPDTISAAFYYVAHDRVIRPTTLLGADELGTLIASLDATPL